MQFAFSDLQVFWMWTPNCLPLGANLLVCGGQHESGHNLVLCLGQLSVYTKKIDTLCNLFQDLQVFWMWTLNSVSTTRC